MTTLHIVEERKIYMGYRGSKLLKGFIDEEKAKAFKQKKEQGEHDQPCEYEILSLECDLSD